MNNSKSDKKVVFAKWALVLLCVMFSSCRKHTPDLPNTEIWGPTSYWHASEQAGKEPLQGIDQGSIAAGLWDGGPVFVVWVGEQGGGDISTVWTPVDPETQKRVFIYKGTLAGVPFEYRTSDGKGGTITIGGAPYDLAQGIVLLVSKSGAKLQVKQLGLGSLNLKPMGSLTFDEMTDEYLWGLARTNADIRAFWDSGATMQ